MSEQVSPQAKLTPWDPYGRPETHSAPVWHDYRKLIGKVHTFPDGIKLRIVDIKIRDGGVPWVISEHIYSGAQPRRHIEPITNFLGQFGHLF